SSDLIHQRIASAHDVAGLHLDVLALRDQVLARLIRLLGTVDTERRRDHLSLALGVLAEADHAVDLADDGVILRLPSLEQLRDTRQTAGDVLHLGHVARDAGDGVTGVNHLAVLRHDVRAHRQQVARVQIRPRDLHRLTRLRVVDGDAGPQIRRARLDHDLARQTGDLVHLLDHGDAFDEIPEAGDAPHLGEDRRREGVPLGDGRGRRHARPVLELEGRAVDQAVVLALATGVVHDHQLTVAVHHHDGAVLLAGELRVAELDRALGARLERALLDLAAR